jgi:hypothetical protein
MIISAEHSYLPQYFNLSAKYWRYISVAILIVIAFDWQGTKRSDAQEKSISSLPAATPFEEGRIPADAILAITAWPSRTLKIAGTDLFPWEVIGAKSEEELGFDPISIERVDVAVGLPPMGATVPSVGALVTLSTDASIENLSSEVAVGPVEKRLGVDIRRLKDENFYIGSIDARQHVVGTINYVASMVRGNNKPSKLSALCSAVKPQSDLTVLISLEPVMPLLEGVVEGQIDQIPPAPAELAKAMVANAEYIAIAMDAGQGLTQKSRMVIGTKTEEGAVEVSRAWKSTIEFGLAMLKEQMLLPQESEKVQAASRLWLERFIPTMRTLMTPQQKGKRLMIEANSTAIGIPGIGVAAGLLLPAIQQAREAARRMSCSSNFRQCGIAILNYEYAYKLMPAAAIVDATTGKPLLSWRVAILPFADQQQLYSQFKLDEPWDSPHNIKLLDKMPAFLKCPSSVTPNGKTTYLAVSSETSAFHPTKPTTLASFTDGTSNTIMLVEVDDAHAVPWTAPMDFEPTPAAIKNILGSNHFGGYHVLNTDCSVRFMSESVNIEELMALFTRAGNEITKVP